MGELKKSIMYLEHGNELVVSKLRVLDGINPLLIYPSFPNGCSIYSSSVYSDGILGISSYKGPATISLPAVVPKKLSETKSYKPT